jgi:hypothetical protein
MHDTIDPLAARRTGFADLPTGIELQNAWDRRLWRRLNDDLGSSVWESLSEAAHTRPASRSYRASLRTPVFSVAAEGDDPFTVGALVLGIVGGALVLTSPAGWGLILKGAAAGALALYALPKLVARICPRCWTKRAPGPA